MRITSFLFEAHLKCPTKCWLRSNANRRRVTPTPNGLKSKANRAKCKAVFGIGSTPHKRRRRSKFGKSLLAYIFYHAIELFVPVRIVARSLSRLFGLNLSTGTVASFKSQ